jgi:hypothetical protein
MVAIGVPTHFLVCHYPFRNVRFQSLSQTFLTEATKMFWGFQIFSQRTIFC